MSDAHATTDTGDLLIAHSACAPHVPVATRWWVLGSDVSARLVEQHGAAFSALHVLETEPENKDAFAHAATCERQRYARYVPLLANRLRRIHGLNHPDLFWERIMGMSLLMHVSNVLRIIRACELFAEVNGAALVRSASQRRADWVPPNEGAYRQCFQFEEGGDERLVTDYARLFPDRLRLMEAHMPDSELAPEPRRAQAVMPGSGRLARLWRRRRELLPELLVRVLRIWVSPRLLATHLYWRTEARQRIELRSFGRVRFELPRSFPSGEPVVVRHDWRAILSEPPEGADDFDRLFFESLRMSAPASWLETLSGRMEAARRRLAGLTDLRWIVNESLDEDSLLLCGVGAESGISVALCEHNYLQQQYLGNMVWYMSRKVDVYLSLGWADVRYPNVVPAGSCFGWTEGRRVRPDIDVLYVSGVCVTRPTVTSAGYSTSGTINSARYLAMKKAFFDGLSPEICKRIYYRDYPAWKRETFGVHSLDRRFAASLLNRVGVLDDQGQGSSTQLLNRCRVVVTDYCSTTYIQALLADVPTIVLFNQASYYLEEQYQDFFDELISARIFHPDPTEAADFLETILDDPNTWWNSGSVRTARSAFLRRNLGSEETLQAHVLALMHGRFPAVPAQSAEEHS